MSPGVTPGVRPGNGLPLRQRATIRLVSGWAQTCGTTAC